VFVRPVKVREKNVGSGIYLGKMMKNTKTTVQPNTKQKYCKVKMKGI